MCFCLLLLNLVILLSWYFLVFWFCSVVVLLSYSWFGRQVWVINYFFLTSWKIMISTLLHHFRIAFHLPMIALIFILLHVLPVSFFFWTLSWRSMLDALNAPARQPHNWTWSARRLLCRQVIQYFNLSDFLLTHSGSSVLLFMGRSSECCRYVMQFSC